MVRPKSLEAKLTRQIRSKIKTDQPVHQMLIGIEAKIEYHPFLKAWGGTYQSLLRTVLNDRQKGLTETEIEKAYQKRYRSKGYKRMLSGLIYDKFRAFWLVRAVSRTRGVSRFLEGVGRECQIVL